MSHRAYAEPSGRMHGRILLSICFLAEFGSHILMEASEIADASLIDRSGVPIRSVHSQALIPQDIRR
jgi:hypothetical protein